MPITIAELRAIVSADSTQFDSKLAKVKSDTEAAGKSIGSVFDGMGAGFLKAGAAMSAAFTLPLVAVTEMGREFETQLRRVAANTAMTDAELNKMREVVISIGRDSAAPLSDLAHGFEHAANFGFNAAESAKILDIAMQGAVTTGAKTEAVTNTLAGVLHIFGKSADEAAVTMNTLKEAAGKGNLTLEQFVSVSGRVFATAANLGLNLNEAAGAMSALTRAGFPAAQASTQLVGALNHLVNPTKEIQGELQRLSKTTGIDLVSDFSQAALQSKGFAAILGDVKKAVGDNTAEALKLFGGLRGGLGAMALIGNASEDYRSILEKLSETMAGKLTPVQDAYAREVVTLSFQLGELTNKFTLLGSELNKSFGATQAGFIKGISDAVDAVTRGLAAADPVATTLVTTLIAGFAIGGPVVLGIGAIITLLGGPVAVAIVGVTATLSVLFAEAVTGAKDGATQTMNFKDTLLQLAQAFGVVLDILGVVGNTLAGLAKAAYLLATPLFELVQIIQGDFKGAWHTFSVVSSQAFQDMLSSFSAAGQDLQGRWTNTLSGMVQSGFSSVGGFGAAGTAAGNAFFGNIAKAAQRFPIKAFGMDPASQAISNQNVQWGKRGAMSDAEVRLVNDAIDATQKKIKPLVVPPISPPPSGGGKGSVKEAIDNTLSQVNDWLRATERNINLSDNAWKLLPKSTQAAFKEQADQFHKSTEAAQAWAALQLAAALKTGEAYAPALHLVLDAVDELVPAEKELTGVIESANAMMEAGRPAAADMSASLTMLKAALHNLKEDIAASPLFNALKMKDETAHAFDEVINLTKAEGERLGLTEDQINQKILANLAVFGKQFGEQYGISADQAITIFKRQMDKLPGALDEIFNKLALGAKHQVAGLFQVIDSIPGKFGDALRKSTSTITTWINQIDGILKGLHKIFQGIPDGLAGALQSLVGIFKGTTSSIQTAVGGVASSAASAGTKVADMLGGTSKGVTSTSKTFKAGFSAMEGALASFATAAAVTIGTGSKTAGFLSSLATSAMAGIQAGLVGGPIAGAVVGGISMIGGLIGMFMGKSALQKAQEAAALQKAKDDIKLSQQAVEQAFEATKQSILETADKARELLEAITFYTKVPKDAFKAFFEDLDKLMKAFAEHAKSWMVDASGKIKVFSEDMKATMEAVALAPTALVGIGKYLGVAESSINRFFADLTKVFESFGSLADAFTRKAERHMRQFADRMSSVTELLTGTVEAIKGMVDLKPIPESSFATWEDSLRMFVSRLQGVAEYFDKYAVKAIEFFAEKLSPAMGLWKDSTDAIRSMVDLPMPSGSSFENLFASIRAGLAGFIELANTMPTEMLIKAESIAQSSMAIFAAIKAAVDSLTGLSAFKGVPDEAYQNVLADFKRGVVMISLLLLDATEFEDKAKSFEQIVLSGMQHFSAGISAYVGGWTSAAQALTAMPSGGSSLTPGPGFGSVGGMSTQSMSAQSHTTYINIGDLNIPEGSVAGELIKKLVDELRGIATGGTQRDPLLA
jgi:TP901 family phage tail tape measure protein